MIAYRVFLRSGRQLIVRGDAELARVLSRKTPAAYHHEVAAEHTCSVCGATGLWDENWLSYRGIRWQAGRKPEVDDGIDETFCSRACWLDHTGGPDLAPWVWSSITDEPVSRALKTARWVARRADERAERERTDYRKVPMPEWPGRKHCRWCARPIPRESKRQNWHEDCLKAYWLHADLSVQFRFLAERDGRVCCEPGCETTGGLEVDHDIPLWQVRDLPADDRLHFYGPENLKLRCGPCHKAKTAREAAKRARGPHAR